MNNKDREVVHKIVTLAKKARVAFLKVVVYVNPRYGGGMGMPYKIDIVGDRQFLLVPFTRSGLSGSKLVGYSSSKERADKRAEDISKLIAKLWARK